MAMVLVSSERVIVVAVCLLDSWRRKLHVHGHGAGAPQGGELRPCGLARHIPGGAHCTLAATDDLKTKDSILMEDQMIKNIQSRTRRNSKSKMTSACRFLLIVKNEWPASGMVELEKPVCRDDNYIIIRSPQTDIRLRPFSCVMIPTHIISHVLAYVSTYEGEINPTSRGNDT